MWIKIYNKKKELIQECEIENVFTTRNTLYIKLKNSSVRERISRYYYKYFEVVNDVD